MSQTSEDCSAEDTSPPNSAQVPPSERPRSELQRAVQLRAQESMERQRARASTKPNPVPRIAAFALALIPVALLFFAVDGLLRVFHHMNDLYNSPEALATEAAQAAQQEPPVEEVEQVQPGVVMLVPQSIDKSSDKSAELPAPTR